MSHVTESKRATRVLKFGGSSVENVERIRAAAAIAAGRASTHDVVVVVSAMGGATDDLARAAEHARSGSAEAREILTAFARRHREAAAALAPAEGDNRVAEQVERWILDLEHLLHGVSLVRECTPRTLDAILSYGELCSSLLVAAALRADGVAARALDARSLIITDDAFGHAIVDRMESYARIRDTLTAKESIPVVTGFIASTHGGETTTLGRGGSDYTASLLGAAVLAEAVEIWTDVDGVMSADPRLVPQAFSIPRLSYVELMELSHFGAKVVFPPSVHPARERGIPIVIRNTLNPAFDGTWVLPDDREKPVTAEDGTAVPLLPAQPGEAGLVRGISSINNVVLCRLQGPGMVGVSGTASRLFGALARESISIILISQASSEHSICIALAPSFTKRAQRKVNDEFELERRAGLVDDLIVEEDLSVVALVGENMPETPGIAGRLFEVLGRNGISVRAIAQGSSELNISLVVRRQDEERALRVIHDAFFLPRTRAAQVFIAGTGRVGSALLEQIAAETERLSWRMGVHLILGGIARRRTAVVDETGIPPAEWRERLAASADAPMSRDVIEAALESRYAHRIFVDCTGSPDVARHYEELLRRGVAVVTASKLAVSGSLDLYRRLRDLARKGNGMFIETTVGAGLPVLRPIADLVSTGDLVARIEGVLSGTLSFIFSRVMAGAAFSDAVREAHARGFTEPDPRDDLSGTDVSRKLLILAREAGFEPEPADVCVEPVLAGERWSAMSLDEFWGALPSADEEFALRRDAALSAGRRLCYLAAVGHTEARVALREIGPEHPCANLSGSDNLIAVTSQRYAETPLVIRGPGAGPDVTAAGVFADILRAAVESR